MTQAPRGGQTAPRNADYGSYPTAAREAQRDTPNWSPPGSAAPQRSGSQQPTTQHAPSLSGPSLSGPSLSAPSQSGPPSTPPVSGSYAGPPPTQAPTRSDTTTGSMSTVSSSMSSDASGRTSRAARNRGPRRARLQLRHINPWTVLKFSCVLSVALFFVWLIVVGVLFGILDGAGIIGKINDTVTTIQGGDSTAPVTAGVVFGAAAIIGVINVVLFIALSTIGSLIYNLCADLVGGVEVTLSER